MRRGADESQFYLYEDLGDRVEVVGPDVMTQNGHGSYLPGKRWILNDTYPDKEQYQHVYLCHVESRRHASLGHFYTPPKYRDEWRCDLHPGSARTAGKW